MQRALSTVSTFLGLLVVGAYGAGCAECQYYNDCPDNGTCQDGVCVPAVTDRCEVGGASEYFLKEGSLKPGEHWECKVRSTTEFDAPHFTAYAGNTNVVSGGSTRLRLDWLGPVDLLGKTIYWGIKGERSLHRIVVDQETTANPLPWDLYVSSDAPPGEFTAIIGFELSGDGPASPTMGPLLEIPFRVIPVGGGDVQVSLVWDTAADVDLWVKDPSGEIIGYSSTTSSSGGKLDLDSNAGCTSGPRNENIYWETDTAQSGVYEVWVNYWSACEYPAPTEFRVTRVLHRTDIASVDGVLAPNQADQIFHPSTTTLPPMMTFSF